MGGAGAGGISGLVGLLERDGEALDYDLQAIGLSVADIFAGRLTLRRLRDLLTAMPLTGTALWRKRRREPVEGGKRPVDPPADWWTPDLDLLASVVDALHVLAWQNTEDARHGRNAPKPIPRPGVGPRRKQQPAGDVIARLEAMSGRSLRAPRGDAGADEHDQADGAEGSQDDAGDGQPGAAPTS